MGGNDGDFGDCCSNDGKSGYNGNKSGYNGNKSGYNGNKSGYNGNTSGYNQSTVILETNGTISKYIRWAVCSPTF